MECNKEEALRAKEIAEKKMEHKDFFGARKIALKAQQLYPDLENITQMIMVCDVHCSAETIVYGNEKDWYGILKIEPAADESSIKKQYRKFALLLHPDKNKFAGSADAFKLIGEAQRVLLDRERRLLHDTMRKTSVRPAVTNGASKQSSGPTNMRQHAWNQNNFTGVSTNSQFQHQRHQKGIPETRPTFWTICPFCSVRYQFYREVVNKHLCCQSCKRTFTGYEMNNQDIPATKISQPSFPQNTQVPFQRGPQNTTKNSTSQAGFQGNDGQPKESKPHQKVNESKRKQVEEPKSGFQENNDQPKERKNGKGSERRRKLNEESSESCDSESSTDAEEEISISKEGKFPFGADFQSYREQPRRSSRSKRNVSYSENLSDDDAAKPSKRAKSNRCSDGDSEQRVEDSLQKEDIGKMDSSPDAAADVEEDERELKKESCNRVKSKKGNRDAEKEDIEESPIKNGGSSPRNVARETYEYPDPDFSDFDKVREQDRFKAGQIWAVYDEQDGMPRFYTLIRKVLSPGFQLQITWLEPELDPVDAVARKLAEEDFSFSCGTFRHGDSQNTKDHPMFSHMVSFERGDRRDTYKIYPKKGETWALFKNLDIKSYSSSSDSKRKFEYEFVEILSDYDTKIGVLVACLQRVKGFTCLFSRKMGRKISFPVPPKEMFKFSHQVPSFQIKEERENVPKGSFELDPAASVPPTTGGSSNAAEEQKFENPLPKEDVGNLDRKSNVPGSNMEKDKASSQNVAEETKMEAVSKTPHVDVEISSEEDEPEVYEIPDPDFSDFDKDRKEEDFAVGQIWAVYDTLDAMPRFYARIRKVLSPGFKLQISWLEPDPDDDDEDEIEWVNEELPVSCGNFKRGTSDKAEDHPMFSHLASWEKGSRRDTFKILPRKGETWAIFKYWDIKWHSTNIKETKKFEYEFVEILSEYDNKTGIRVAYLAKVKGFTCLFHQKPDRVGSTLLIPPKEKFRFSHRVPSFRLTGEERNDVPKGSFELDPACLPAYWGRKK